MYGVRVESAWALGGVPGRWLSWGLTSSRDEPEMGYWGLPPAFLISLKKVLGGQMHGFTGGKLGGIAGVKGVIVELGGGGHVVPIGGEVERSRPGDAALRGYRFARAVIWEAGLVGVGDADIVRILCPDGEMLVDD